jgi:hypothetical protein
LDGPANLTNPDDLEVDVASAILCRMLFLVQHLNSPVAAARDQRNIAVHV